MAPWTRLRVEAPQGYLFDRWASGGVFAAFFATIVIAAWYLFKSRDA